jgi:hypothetical protein
MVNRAMLFQRKDSEIAPRRARSKDFLTQLKILRTLCASYEYSFTINPDEPFL